MCLNKAAKVILYRQGLILKLNIVYINLIIDKRKTNMEKELGTDRLTSSMMYTITLPSHLAPSRNKQCAYDVVKKGH